MNYFDKYIQDQAVESRQSALFHIGDRNGISTFSFRESGNTFHQYELDLYRQTLILATDRETFMEASKHFLDSTNPVSPNADGQVRVIRDYGPVLIGVFDGIWTTLTHESVHAALRVFRRVGASFDADNDEPLAYLVHHIFEKFADAVAASVAE